MFERIGKAVERWWPVVLVVWLVALLFSDGLLKGKFRQFNLPAWKDLVQDGEFAYLPKEVQSLVGEKLLSNAFPQDLLKSSVVIIVRRENQNNKLSQEDFDYIENELRPELEKIKARPGSLISSIKTPQDKLIGQLLEISDQRAALVIVALTSEFLFEANRGTVIAIEEMLAASKRPIGLDVATSGSATVGRDMIQAAAESSRSTEHWTIILVIVLLLAIYRAPVLALIPLLTVFVAVEVSMAMVTLLTHLAIFKGFRVFNGLEVYIMVVVYGTGVDYCLFLIARYKEEIDNGQRWKQALSSAMGKIGAALTASALTVICGIGMMFFAQFGKFREAGIFISLSLCVGLLASLTLTPALLRAAGRFAFWPYVQTQKLPEVGGWISGTTLFSRLFDGRRVHRLWEWMGQTLLHSPGKLLVGCILGMLPFAALGFWKHDFLSYGLLSELRGTTKSVVGAKAVQAHFPAGYAGPLTVILQSSQDDFLEDDGKKILTDIVAKLTDQKTDLKINDIRSLDTPLGLNTRKEEGGGVAKVLQNAALRNRAREYYVSSNGDLAGHVTRFDVIFEDDPFSRESIRQLTSVEDVIRNTLPPGFLKSGTINFVGPTASIRDLKTVTDQDQIRIDALVMSAVFLILVILLRKPAISLYLILSVFFSYFVTLGVSLAFFWWIEPRASEFAGLDWKVPIFLFTILIAIGEDYNIFLMTRIEEEQRLHGPVEGIRVAVQRTGSIISSCGIIMAGTFCSLMFGTLVGMQQLGFALAFGVLLDTFVVRPVLVPAYLVMLHSGRFGRMGRWLGASTEVAATAPAKGPGVTPPLSDPRTDVA